MQVVGTVTSISGERPNPQRYKVPSSEPNETHRDQNLQAARRPKPSQWLKILLDSDEPQKPKAPTNIAITSTAGELPSDKPQRTK